MTGILVSFFSLNVCLQLLLCVFVYTSQLHYVQSLFHANGNYWKHIELNNKINELIVFIHDILFHYIRICIYLIICNLIIYELTRQYQSFVIPLHLIVHINSYCPCIHLFYLFSMSLLLFTTVILYILLMFHISAHLCHMWPVVYIITIISIALPHRLYNILLTSLFRSIIIMKAISVPVWDYWHTTYSYVFTWLYASKVNTFYKRTITIHVWAYYIADMFLLYRYLFTSKLLYYFWKINMVYYSELRVHLICSVLTMREQMYRITCDYGALSHYLILLNHG